ncbi:MAG: DUF732 domain-containing protein [Segniliparus sp.]|uniref:DUF732 domain-containing protein n=1 Tax=Segniliparus sp. TaxID=2804064 RepID=UPI003F3B9952
MKKILSVALVLCFAPMGTAAADPLVTDDLEAQDQRFIYSLANNDLFAPGSDPILAVNAGKAVCDILRSRAKSPLQLAATLQEKGWQTQKATLFIAISETTYCPKVFDK